MSNSRNDEEQDVSISLSRQVLKKVRVLAARRETSISGLLAQQIESLVGDDEAYERAQRQALEILEKGFHMGDELQQNETNCMSDKTLADSRVLVLGPDVDAEARRPVSS